MFESFKLGVVYKDGKIINHRSLIKVLLNPFLRWVGICIATKFVNNQISYPVLMFCDIQRKNPFKYEYDNDYDRIEFTRIII